MAWTSYIVRVDTAAGFRKTYTFDTIEEANSFIISCEDRVVAGPIRILYLTPEEDD